MLQKNVRVQALAADYFLDDASTSAVAVQAQADITANQIIERAKMAYAYAKAQYGAPGAAGHENAACSNSKAASNCIGAGCQRRADGPCDLYCAP